MGKWFCHVKVILPHRHKDNFVTNTNNFDIDEKNIVMAVVGHGSKITGGLKNWPGETTLPTQKRNFEEFQMLRRQ